VVLLGFSTGTKSEFRIFEEIKLKFLTGTKSQKYHFFAFGTGKKTPKKSKKKIQKKFFCEYLCRSNYLIFGPKKFLKNFGAAFGTWYYHYKKKI
jgi:hypothetical protein